MLMAYVMLGNFQRVVRGFKPFVPDLGDRCLDIRTFNPVDPTIHCLLCYKSHRVDDRYYPAGLYVYVDTPGRELLLYNPTTDYDSVEGLISVLDMGNVYNAITMGSLNFSYQPLE